MKNKDIKEAITRTLEAVHIVGTSLNKAELGCTSSLATMYRQTFSAVAALAACGDEDVYKHFKAETKRLSNEEEHDFEKACNQIKKDLVQTLESVIRNVDK